MKELLLKLIRASADVADGEFHAQFTVEELELLKYAVEVAGEL